MKSIFCVICVSAHLFAATIPAIKVDSPPKIDGTIHPAEWQPAAIISDFIQREPNTGEAVSQKTIVYVCYDNDNLYVAFDCFENPENITAKQMARDAVLANEDKVVIMLDTFLDRRNNYWFEINARGSKGDALFSQNGAVMNKEWDGIWDARSSIQKTGWQTEVAIPFKTLNFHPHQSTWGIKFVRAIMHNSELSYWPVANLNSLKYQISDAGELTGLTDITQGIGLDIRPYALGSLIQKHDKETELQGDAGLDVFYQLTPGLKSVLTINTDFAQTEVDDRQVNLTRFKLFFPEKRDFFLDGANYMTFGIEGESENPKSRQLIPFFSRRIGLSDVGTPIPILGGIKLTGQHGHWNFGILDVIDRRKTGDQNFAVARITRNLGAQSAVGFITTHGNAESDARNSVFGADLKLATSTLGGDKNMVYYLYGLQSSTEKTSGKNSAFGTEISYPNDFLNFRAGYMQIDENFVAGVGFVPRSNIRNSYGSFGLGPRPNTLGIMQLLITSSFDYITDLDNRLLTRQVEFEPLGFRFLSGDEFGIKLNQKYEALDENFPIFADEVIPPGRYSFLRKSLRLASAQRRQLWGQLRLEWGDFWNGTADKIELSGGYKVSVPVALEFDYEHNAVELPTGDFTVDVYRLNFDLLFTPSITLKNFIQYDDESRRIGWQSRFRWILKPGNELLFVWNSIWSDPLERMDPRFREFTLAESTSRIKLNYNYRF